MEERDGQDDALHVLCLRASRRRGDGVLRARKSANFESCDARRRLREAAAAVCAVCAHLRARLDSFHLIFQLTLR